MSEVAELFDGATGLWNVQTETSSYVINMDERIAMRVPASGAGIHPDHAENRIVVVNTLPHDNDWFSFTKLEQCEVGKVMYIYEDSRLGKRRSTLVRKIQRVYNNEQI